MKTEIGKLKLQIPRESLGLFEQRTTSTYLESQDSLEQSLILLYKKGISTREISDLIEKMYGHHYSAQTISNMSQIVEEKVALYKQRPVKRRYTVLFCDATFINVRRDTVAKEALHVIIGIDEFAYKAKDRSEAEAKLTDFVEKWESQYPKVTGGYQAKDNLFTFLDFPETIRPISDRSSF